MSAPPIVQVMGQPIAATSVFCLSPLPICRVETAELTDLEHYPQSLLGFIEAVPFYIH